VLSSRPLTAIAAGATHTNCPKVLKEAAFWCVSTDSWLFGKFFGA